MAALDQVLKWVGELPLDRLARFLPLDGQALEKLAANTQDIVKKQRNRERMSSVDTAWLRMDTPTNLMMIVGVMMFDNALDMGRFKRTLDHRLMRYKRFRQRVEQDASGAYWAEDENFDIDNHVHTVNLPSPGGKVALEGLAAALATQALDHNKPLWTMTVVEQYDGHGANGSAIIVRIHHCIADGIALIGVMHSLTDGSPDAPEQGTEPEALRRTRDRRAERRDVEAETDSDPVASLFEPRGGAAAKALAGASAVWHRSQQMLANPDRVAVATKVAADVATELAALALLPADSPTSFKGKPSAVKRVAWSEPLPLADIKSVCKVLGVSVNDILLSCCAGAMGDYLRSRGEATEGVEVRGMVPVNLRTRGAEHKLGNHFGLVLLTLPVGIENPFQRLYEVKRRMDALKSSYQAMISMGILGAVGFLPRPLQKQVLDLFSTKASAVMTNVPGPQQPLYMAGNRLAQQLFWVPQSGDIGIGVSILSYNNQVQFGLISDRKFVPVPAEVVDRFAPEFEKLVFYLLLHGQAPAGSAGSAGNAAHVREDPPFTPRGKAAAKRGRADKPRTKTIVAPARAPGASPPPGIRKGGRLKRLRGQGA
jgi:WS/DGAT/MGAT family acyltransferase